MAPRKYRDQLLAAAYALKDGGSDLDFLAVVDALFEVPSLQADRQPVYTALDKLPDIVFSAYLCAIVGINKVMALTVLDDPTPAAALDAAMQPHIAKLG